MHVSADAHGPHTTGCDASAGHNAVIESHVQVAPMKGRRRQKP